MKYHLEHPYLSRVLVLVGLDAICLALASALAWLHIQPALTDGVYAAATATGALLAFLALSSCDAYSPCVIGNGRATLASVRNSMGIAFVAAIAFYYTVPVPEGGVACLAQTAAIYFPLLLLERAGFRAVCNLPSMTRRVVVLGTSTLGSEIARVMREQRNSGIELVGFLSDELAYDRRDATFYEFPVVGKIHHIEKIIDSESIDHIVVATTGREDYFPRDVLQLAKVNGCFVESGVSFLERIAGKIYLRDLHAGYLIFSKGFRMGRLESAIKRAIDVVASSVALVIVAPVIGICAAAIKLESRGPALFRQTRLGIGNEPFVMYKLRSMRENAEAETGAVFTSQGDSRVTKVGSFIRRTRLDELPQLWNILRGEMTLVGPRAERPEFVETLDERYVYYRLRSSVKPGLTGWAQTRYGYVSDVDAYEEKLALDIYYLKHRSLSMDLLILWNTVKTVVLARGL